jgi:hypothetical protein
VAHFLLPPEQDEIVDHDVVLTPADGSVSGMIQISARPVIELRAGFGGAEAAERNEIVPTAITNPIGTRR